MLALLICNCHNSESLGRRALREAGVAKWLSVKSYKGRGASLSFCHELEDYCEDNSDVPSLMNYIKQKGSYVIVVGYTENGFMWADYGNGKTKDSVKAKMIAKEFAN